LINANNSNVNQINQDEIDTITINQPFNKNESEKDGSGGIGIKQTERIEKETSTNLEHSIKERIICKLNEYKHNKNKSLKKSSIIENTKILNNLDKRNKLKVADTK